MKRERSKKHEGEVIEIAPQVGRQEAFLSTVADIAVYGGSAGGGKTWALLLDPLRYVHIEGFNALILRRTYAEIAKPGGMWDEASKIYPYIGGKPNKVSWVWKFPSGAKVAFSHLQYDKDLNQFLGMQAAMIGFDQLETFTEKQFWFLVGRNRSTCGVKPYIRCTCNPDPDSFVRKLLDWWIGEDGYADLSKEGVLRWFIRTGDREIIWGDSREELIERYGAESNPMSITFIPATVYDNPKLIESDPAYISKLKAMTYIERERFLGDPRRGGNWDIKPEAGKVFDRSWFEIVDSAPEWGAEVRGFDFAAALRSMKNKDPDYTASVKIRKVGEFYFVTSCDEIRISAGEIDQYFVSMVQQDKRMAMSENCTYAVRWETEPGGSGMRETVRMMRLIPDVNSCGYQISGDKISRWRAFAAACASGKVKVVAGRWNERFLSALHSVPDSPHDDIPDAASIAFRGLEEISPPERDVKKKAKSDLWRIISNG